MVFCPPAPGTKTLQRHPGAIPALHGPSSNPRDGAPTRPTRRTLLPESTQVDAWAGLEVKAGSTNSTRRHFFCGISCRPLIDVEEVPPATSPARHVSWLAAQSTKSLLGIHWHGIHLCLILADRCCRKEVTALALAQWR